MKLETGNTPAEGIFKPTKILWRVSAFLWLCLQPLLWILLVPGLPLISFEGPMGTPKKPDTNRKKARRLTGWALGLACGAICAQLMLIAPGVLFAPFVGDLLAQDGQFTVDEETQLRVMTFATIAAITATVFAVFIYLRIRSRSGIRAPVAIVSLLSMIVTLYLLFGSIDYVIDIYKMPVGRVFGRCLVVVAAMAWIAWSNSDNWKLTFPGLEHYYPAPGDPEHAFGIRDLDRPESWGTPVELPPCQEDILERWLAQFPPPVETRRTGSRC